MTGNITSGFMKVFDCLGWALVVSSVISVIVGKTFRHGGSTYELNNNLQMLNESIVKVNDWLKWWWLVVLLACISVLCFCWVFGLIVMESKINKPMKIIKRISFIKSILFFVSLSTFVSGSVFQQIEHKKQMITNAKISLDNVQVELFTKTRTYLIEYAVLAAVDTVSSRDDDFNQTVKNYNIVYPYIEHSPQSDKFVEQITAPDLSMSKVSEVEAGIKTEQKELRGEGVLVSKSVSILWDRTVSSRINEIIDTGNPLLNNFIQIFLDSLVNDRGKEYIAAIASDWIEGKIDARTAKLKAQGLGVKYGEIIRLNTPEVKNNSDTFGLSDWDLVRSKMHDAVVAGLRKPVAIQNDARAFMDKFDGFVSSVHEFYQYSDRNDVNEEKIFRNYLKNNADYAALWGYAVIAFTPERLQEKLTMIVQKDVANDLSPTLKALSKDKKNDIYLMTYGLDPEVIRNLEGDSLNEYIANLNGAHPEQGYRLYGLDTTPNEVISMVTYYDKDPVATFVKTYCPK